jgi:hypothetical protein
VKALLLLTAFAASSTITIKNVIWPTPGNIMTCTVIVSGSAAKPCTAPDYQCALGVFTGCKSDRIFQNGFEVKR